MHAYMHPGLQASMHAEVHRYIHTYVHTYIHIPAYIYIEYRMTTTGPVARYLSASREQREQAFRG